MYKPTPVQTDQSMDTANLKSSSETNQLLWHIKEHWQILNDFILARLHSQLDLKPAA